jgi:ANTAR domain
MNERSSRTADAPGAAAKTAEPEADPGPAETAPEQPDRPQVVVVRRGDQGWRVADEELPDLVSAIVLADLLASELPGTPMPATIGSPPRPGGAAETGQPGDAAAEAARLRVTVAQLEHALATRVRVEQAIGIICERRRVPPRQAFALLRTVARAGGTRLAELAAQVVDSAVNPLLMLPEELARPPRPPRPRGRSPRHARVSE